MNITLKATTASTGAKAPEPFPELGPKRVFTSEGPWVISIGGRKYKIVFVENGGFGLGTPEPGTLTFVETDELESPYTVWDPTAVMAKALEDTVVRLSGARTALADCSPETRHWGEKDVARAEADVAALQEAVQDGECLFSPPGHSAFGQPVFIQNPVYPVHEGRVAYPLLVLETGWGDSGNENYFVALDDDGRPVALFHEASCC